MPDWVVLSLLLGSMVLLAGAWLVWSAFARDGDRPHCRNCGYNVTSQMRVGPGPRRVCPECGAILRARRTTVRGLQRIVYWRLALGVALLAMVVATGAWRLFSGFNWYKVLSDRALVIAVGSVPLDSAVRAFVELQQRVGSGQVSISDQIDAGLHLHRRVPRDHHIWLRYRSSVGQAMITGPTSAQQWRRLAEQAIAGLRVELDPTCEVGQPVAWRIVGCLPTPPETLGLLTLDELLVDHQVVASNALIGPLHLLGRDHLRAHAWQSTLPYRFQKPGTCQLTARFQMELRLFDALNAASVVQETVTISTTFSAQVMESSQGELDE